MKTVCFRNFEPRDLDFIHQCKTDEKLNSMVVGNWKPFTRAQSKAWLDGCIRADNPAYKFWAIATNDDEKTIIGWVCLSQIDMNNLSACFHGIVIADPNYRDGFAWIESYLFIYEYCFEVIGLNRVYGESIVGHKNSNNIGLILQVPHEGIKRQAVFKNGKFYDVSFGALLKEDYFKHKENGDYTMRAIIKRISYLKKNKLFK